MATFTLPDPTKLDADTDSISEARPELKLTADAVVEMGTAWNANGGNFGTAGNYEGLSYASETINVVNAGTYNLDKTKTIHVLDYGTLVSDSAGDDATIKLNLDNLLDVNLRGQRHLVIMQGTVPAGQRMALLPFINSKRARGANSATEFAITLQQGTDIHMFFLYPVSNTAIFIDSKDLTGSIEEVHIEAP